CARSIVQSHARCAGGCMPVRRTKIVATLGPATSSPELIEALVLAGMDVARLNFSHGTPEEHAERARLVREISARHSRYVALMGDLQGPTIRIARFADGKVTLEAGQRFTLSTTYPSDEGTAEIVGIEYPPLPQECEPGDELLLDDGRIVLRVDAINGDAVYTTVVLGGE